MTLHEILRQEEIANCRKDRGQQDSDGRLTLVEQSPDEFECPVKVARSERITQLVDDAAARERDKSADVFQSDVPFLGAEEEIEFLKLAPVRAAVATGEEDEEIERIVVQSLPVFPA